jgi:hypothetical protein
MGRVFVLCSELPVALDCGDKKTFFGVAGAVFAGSSSGSG